MRKGVYLLSTRDWSGLFGIGWRILVVACVSLPGYACVGGGGNETVQNGSIVATDSTPPGSVRDLTVTSHTATSATLSWTAPGNDFDIGRASRYEIRYSQSMIDNASWEFSSRFEEPPVPEIAGARQSITITGLAPASVYYFALKSVDEANNVSPLSNVPSATTDPLSVPDTTPPSSVTDLSGSNATSSSVTLSWTAPGDDGGSGTAASYDIRYSTSMITESNFNAMPQLPSKPGPLAAGSGQSVTVTGLSPSTTYYFALKTRDDAGNVSGLSNVASATTSSGGSAGTTYYVATTGSDSANGSLGSPWRTINHALANTAPGDTIVVRGGSYREEVIIGGDWGYGSGGSPGRYLTLQGYPGEDVRILDRMVTDSSYVRVRGFHFVSAPFVAANWTRLSEIKANIEITDCLFTGAFNVYAGALNIATGNTLAERNTLILSDTGSSNDHGIYVAAGEDFVTDNVIVRNNMVDGAPAYGIHIYDERKNTSDPVRYIRNVVVENNTVINSRSRSGILVAVGARTRVDGVTIRNNVVGASAAQGIMVYDAGGGVSSQSYITNVKIYNNTVYGSGGDNIGIYDGAITNVDIRNNILHIHGNGGYHINDFYGNHSTFTAGRNLYSPSPPALNNITDVSMVIGDPQFVNATGGDFHLAPSSPAIDAGAYLADVTTDKDGTPRPRGSAYDIGAYEYQ